MACATASQGPKFQADALPAIPSLSTRHPHPLHRLSTKQRAVIRQDRPRGIVAGCAGDAAAGMGAGPAVIEALQGTAIIGVAEHRAGREYLVERQRAVEDVAAQEPEL